jgi:hypothetical protein
VLRDGDRDLLTGWARSSSVRTRLAQRAPVLVLTADGVWNAQERGSTVSRYRDSSSQAGEDQFIHAACAALPVCIWIELPEPGQRQDDVVGIESRSHDFSVRRGR